MTTQQIINIGSSPNDGNGDPLRTAFQKTNQNFSVLFGIAGVTGIANGTSNISIPIANSNIIMSVGNVGNVVTILANGMATLGNHSVSAYVNAGNVTSAGTITANGTIQSLSAVTAVTVTASGNLVGSNLNITNQMRASTLLLTGNIVNAELNVTGNVNADTINAAGGLVVAANTSIAGNVSGAFFIGNGSQLTGVTAAPANIFNIMNVTGSPLVIADSPNDTLNFTFGNNLTITGNAVTDTLNFVFSESPTFSGTVTATTFVGDVKGSVFADDSTLMVDAIDNKLFAGAVQATGNITGNYFLGNGSLLTGVITTVSNISNGTSNVTIGGSGGNVNFNVGGINDVMTVTPQTVIVNGNLQIDGELEYINVTTLAIKDPIIGMGRNANNTPLTVNDGKDRGSQLWYYSSAEKSAFFGFKNSSGNLIIANDVTVTNEVVSVNSYGTLQTGNLYPANITTPGTINSSGNVTAPYFLGNVIGNISGNLVVAGSNTEVVFNDNGVANATAGFTFNKATNAVSTSGTVTATANITGGNLITAGEVNTASLSISGNVTGNLLPSANITYNLGSSTQRWNDIWLANSTIYLGNSQISANATALVFTNPQGANTVFSGVSANLVVSAVSASANVTGGNLVTLGNITGGNLSVSTGNIAANNAQITRTISVNSANLATAIENAGANAVGNIGSSSKYFNTLFATSTSALYADLAEKYLADMDYDPGTVLSFGGVNEVTESTEYGDRRIAGVVSTQPAYSMNSGLQGTHVVTLALSGRVPCRVTGAVERGDMMISAGNGMACACSAPALGSVIGKAIQDFAGGDGVIEIVVGRI